MGLIYGVFADVFEVGLMGASCWRSFQEEPQNGAIESAVTSSIYETRLHKAVRDGDFELVKKLVEEQNADVNELNGAGQTPLHEACRCGNDQIASYLIDETEEVDSLRKDDNGRQAITYAAASGLKEIVLKLLAFDGADVNGRVEDGAHEHCTPLWHASSEGHADVVKFLLRQRKIRVDAFNVHHRTCLFQATRNGFIDVVELLLSANADVSLAGLPDLENPLHIASLNGSENQLVIAAMLLGGGADPNAKTRLGYTALVVASIKGFEEMACVLLERGADPNLALPDGLTALHLSCIKGYSGLAEKLVEHGANLNAKDKDGYTPMFYAEQKGHIDCMAAVEKHSRF